MGEDRDAQAEAAQQAFRSQDWPGVLEALPDDLSSGPDVDHLLLLRAEARRRLGEDPHTVRQDILDAVRQAGGRADRLVRAARMLRHLGDVAGALSVARAAVDADPSGTDTTLALAEILGHLGREREAVLALEEGLDTHPDPVRALDAARRRMARSDAAGAAAHAEQVALGSHAPDVVSEARGLAADARIETHEVERARTWLTPQDPAPDLLRRALDTGDLALARQAVERLPDSTAAAWRGRLALWSGDLDGARAHATDAADHPLGRLVAVACDIEDGTASPEAVDAMVEAQAPGDRLDADRPAALTWRGEAKRRAGRTDAARADGHAALDAEGRYALTAHLVVLRADARDRPAVLHPEDPQATVDATPLPAATYWSGPGFDAAEEARQLTALFGTNRSRWPTVVDSAGTLVRVHPTPVPLHAMRPLQASVLVRDPDAVRADIADLRARFPDDPTMMTYGAEVDLWLGRYDDALAASEEALRRCHTQKWAWVGLGASRMFCGDLEGALEAYARGADVTGGDGPSAYVYRGEALWRLGRPREALPDLAEACRRKPTRVGGWLLWARANLAIGQEAPSRKVLGHLQRVAPGAWLDLHRATGPGADPATLLDTMLEMMRGNRSSALPTYHSDGAVRAVTWRPPGR